MEQHKKRKQVNKGMCLHVQNNFHSHFYTFSLSHTHAYTTDSSALAQRLNALCAEKPVGVVYLRDCLALNTDYCYKLNVSHSWRGGAIQPKQEMGAFGGMSHIAYEHQHVNKKYIMYSMWV